jgi:hypothetical protein
MNQGVSFGASIFPINATQPRFPILVPLRRVKDINPRLRPVDRARQKAFPPWSAATGLNALGYRHIALTPRVGASVNLARTNLI